MHKLNALLLLVLLTIAIANSIAIKKLNDEVDTLNRKNENLNDALGMLTKQKEYLQSKLREKGGVANEKSDVGSTREEIRG